MGSKGANAYCVVHRRFAVMRGNSVQRGKTVPSWEELEALIPPDMKCPACSRTMNWTVAGGRSTVLTLQHDRSGTHRFICQGCNTKHASVPGDGFYALKPGEKHCAACGVVKPVEEFSVDKSRPGGRKGSCKSCSSKQFRRWHTSKRERD